MQDSVNTFNTHSELTRLGHLFEQQRRSFNEKPATSRGERAKKLKQLKTAILNYEDRLLAAMDADFGGRSRQESLINDLMQCVIGINHTLRHLKSWMKPERRKVGLLFTPSSNRVVYQPLGVVGIMVAWNYPVLLSLTPLTCALAAGNRALIKMPEVSPKLNGVLKELLAGVFSENEVAVIEGNAEVASTFSALPFDHLLFTGSTETGRKVMQSAAKNLTPVTLELGGKSPAIVSRNIPIAEAARRLCWGKSLNAGQTCVTADYVLVPDEAEETFINAYREAFGSFYPTLKNNPEYTSLISAAHKKRLQNILEEAADKGAKLSEINPASEDLSQSNKMAPVLVQNITDDMLLAQEELFGPVLPVIPYKAMDDALAYIAKKPHPLALFYFGYDKNEENHVIANSQSGGVTINDTLKHLPQHDMPFGGVGDSGMGCYHGHEGFLTFSHARPVHREGRWSNGFLIYPPFDSRLKKLVLKVIHFVFMR